MKARSHSTWVRELKWRESVWRGRGRGSHSTWVRELKCLSYNFFGIYMRSHSTWVHELKFRCQYRLFARESRTPRECVSWNDNCLRVWKKGRVAFYMSVQIEINIFTSVYCLHQVIKSILIDELRIDRKSAPKCAYILLTWSAIK